MPEFENALPIAGLAIFLALLLGLLWRRRSTRAKRPLAVLDGSNVMHWKDGTPRIDPLKATLRLLDKHGFEAGVMFDANAGYLLAGRYLRESALARMLEIDASRVLVVPKGVQADPYLLQYASGAKAIVVSNDRFRDRIEGFPQMAAPGRLVRGGYREGELWLDLPGVKD